MYIRRALVHLCWFEPRHPLRHVLSKQLACGTLQLLMFTPMGADRPSHCCAPRHPSVPENLLSLVNMLMTRPASPHTRYLTQHGVITNDVITARTGSLSDSNGSLPGAVLSPAAATHAGCWSPALLGCWSLVVPTVPSRRSLDDDVGGEKESQQDRCAVYHLR